MIEIKVNGSPIDLFGDDSIAMTYAANNFNDISSRNGEFSNSFTVPATANNINVFGHPQQINTASDFNRVFNSCQVYEDGILIVDGFCKLLSTKEDIEIKIFSGNSTWIDLIGDKELHDIDLSDLDHYFGDAVVNANRLNTTGFVYANCEYGGGVVDFYPSIYYSELVKRIFESIGFTVTGSLLDDALFKKAVVAFSNNNWQKRYEQTWYKGNFKTVNNFSLIAGNAFAAIDRRFGLRPVPSAIVTDITIPGAIVSWKDRDNYGSASLRQTLIRNGDTSFTATILGQLQLRLNTSYGSGTVYVRLVGYDSSSTVVSTNTIGSQSYSGAQTINIDLSAIHSFVPNIDYAIHVDFPVAVTFDCIGGYLQVDDGYPSGLYPQKKNEQTDLAYSLPVGVKQKEFIKHVFNQFCVQITTDYANNSVTLNLSDEIINNAAIDASNIIDHTDNPKIEHFFGEYAQRNMLKYTPDTNDSQLPQFYGDGRIDINSQSLTVEKTLYQSKFALFVRKVVSGVNVASYVVAPNGKTTPRVGYIEQTNTDLVNIVGQTALSTNSHLFCEDLKFENLITNYYSLMKSIVGPQKKLFLNIRLKMVNIIGLSSNDTYKHLFRYNRPIYINTTVNGIHINGYYYLNAINQYKFGTSQSTEVELLPIYF